MTGTGFDSPPRLMMNQKQITQWQQAMVILIFLIGMLIGNAFNMARTDANVPDFDNVGMNSGYLYFVDGTEMWYHIPEEKNAEFLELLVDIEEAEDDELWEECIDELEEDYGKYAVDLHGVRSVLLLKE